MTRKLKNVVKALSELERKLKRHEPLRREAAMIREAFESRLKVIAAMRRQGRVKQPVAPKCKLWIELFLPAAFKGDVLKIEQINVNDHRDLDRWRWWSDVYRGEL
jgi:hypothetical protein